MRLPSILSDIKIAYSVNKAARAPENSSSAVEARFAAWEQSSTTDTIQEALLVALTDEKNEDLDADVTAEELEYFRSITSSLSTGVDDQLDMCSIMQHILQKHKEKREALHLNRTLLETLIISHASFPFINSPKITADALCRSLLLLTDRCVSNFKQQVCLGHHITIRTRTPSARLRFIFSALANPPCGAPTQDDVLDVLCRVKYPTQLAYKGQSLRRPVSALAPLAERLEPVKEQSAVGSMSAATVQQLRELMEAFPSPYQHLVVHIDVDTSGGLRVEEFVKWALQVRVFDTLDQVFGVFFELPEFSAKKA